MTTPTDGIDPKVLKRVRALLDKAESTTFEAEAAALTAKANELMGGESYDSLFREFDSDTRQEVINKIIDLEGSHLNRQTQLLHGIAKRMGVRAVTIDATRTRQQRVMGTRGKASNRVHLFGYAVDIQRVELLFTSLRLQYLTQGKKLVLPEFYGGGMRAFRTAWLAGWIARVIDRVAEAEGYIAEEAKKKSRKKASSTEVVLRTRETEVADAVSTIYSKIVTKRSAPVDARGYQAGQRDAERADIHNTRVGGTAGQLTG